MTDTRTGDIVGHYVASLRGALADLPAQDVDDIMEDVGLHVAEVADELRRDGDDGLADRLRERLGTPEQHAAELRAAAGYPPRVADDAAATPDLVAPRIALGLLAVAIVLPLFGPAGGMEGMLLALVLAAGVALVSLLLATRGGGLSAVAELPEVRRAREQAPRGVVREYALLLQPAWWVLRGGIAAVLVLSVLWVSGEMRGGLGTLVLLAIPLVLASVWVGRRSRTDRRWLWAVLPLNAFAIAVVLYLAGHAPWFGWGAVYLGGANSGVEVVYQDRTGNIYPYDSTGQPLDGVYLYDEDGQPISGTSYRSECTPFGDTPPPPANRYPLPVYQYVETPDGVGRCVERSVAPPSPDVPEPTRGASPTGSAQPTPTGSAPPTTSAGTTTGATTVPPTT